MGKSKGKGSGKGGKQGKEEKCICEHPFQCSCGNRPERPSRGHKWDPEKQQWGGKGHKQKGASGQTSSKAVEATTTSVGKTAVSQWQRLPSQLLDDVTKKEGRPRAKYKSVGQYKFRIIIQDAKVSRRGTSHDLLFVPVEACGNEEQAKEEAALLALLYLTPNIPHERKLPEPYKTTWLHAVQALKESKGTASKIKSTMGGDRRKIPAKSVDSGGGAQASTNLRMGNSFASLAQRKEQRDKKLQERNAKIRKHEAIRLANKDHQVFLSAQMRKKIETLLRGEVIQWNEHDEKDSNDDEEVGIENDLKEYVVGRLKSEGFTKSQAYTSILKMDKSKLANAMEEQWETIYDECLQWLCIHLDEDQLPEGFDPRGRTLDVIVAKEADSNTTSPDKEVEYLASRFGLQVPEATVLLEEATKEGLDVEDVAWRAFCRKAKSTLVSSVCMSQSEDNVSIAGEEIETLDAIFAPGEFYIKRASETTTISLSIPSEVESERLELEIVTRNGVYPKAHVDRLLISGKWSKRLGVSIHVQLIQFLSELELSEPMIYNLYGKTQCLLQEAADGDIKMMSLSSAVESTSSKSGLDHNNEPKTTNSRKVASAMNTSKVRRPRQKSPFWSLSPTQTPRAIPFPKVDAHIRKQRETLPAATVRHNFLKLLSESKETGRVVLVTGDTGCGKTTQIPQYILEELPDEAKIVVAQPRRLAATGVASRVASERGDSHAGAGSVGYVVRGDVAICKETRLVFCTTGVLLRQLQSEGALDCLTHIIIDEVHERHLDTDVLLGILKDCLKRTPHIRIVLMSATLDADRFAAYWGPKTPRMHIPGRTFPVKDHTLEDVLKLTGYIPPKKGKKKFGSGFQQRKRASPWDDSEKSDNEEAEENPHRVIGNVTTSETDRNNNFNNIPMGELLKRVDETSIDYDMLGKLVKILVHNKATKGSILIFMPGVPEINKAMQKIGKITGEMNIQLLPLHGGLEPKQQNSVFGAARRGFTKVIISTNVAETSITIPDCTIVIDSCREKQSSYDPVNRMPLLLERFAAKANLKQRRGRAGRVQAGTCYKLISLETFNKLPDHGTPEIHRCALDQILLSLMFLGVERGSGNFMRTLLDPPPKNSLDAAITSLQKLGAIVSSGANADMELTPLGMHLAGIPAPPTIGKMLVMGSILGCRNASLAISAGLSVGRSPFLRVDGVSRQTEDESMEDNKRRKTLEARHDLFKTVGNSDHAMFAAAYLQWDSLVGSKRREYCDLMGLSINGMRDIKQLLRQLDASLSLAGYKSSSESDRNGKSWRTIRACIVAALAPSQLVRVLRPSTKYAETLGGAKEKDGEAKELKFFIQAAADSSFEETENQSTAGTVNRRYHGVAEERVFMHPSSANFSTGNFSCPWLVYHELVRTSKPFLRDATECTAYALLLFGGKLNVQAGNGVIVVSDWIRLAANARIGALVGGLRKIIDQLLEKKIEDPNFDITITSEMKLVNTLLITDGLGQ